MEGITTISTNFSEMGGCVVNMILKNELKNEEIPFTLTLRPSL